MVCLSTIGADAPHENLLTQRTLLEQALAAIGLPVTFLRPGWFMENALWDVPSARDEGVLHSFLQPADKAFPMVATQDVGHQAAALLREDWTGTRVVELEGPARVSPNDLARAFAKVLQRPVKVEIVAARELGADLPCPGRAQSAAADPHARRLQRGLDRVPRPWPIGGQGHDHA